MQRQHHHIDTDLETDDKMAIVMRLRKHAFQGHTLFVCVGESKQPGRKLAAMRRLLLAVEQEMAGAHDSDMGAFAHVDIIPGMPSDEEYPYEDEEDEPRPVGFLQMYEASIAKADTYDMMKPPRELLMLPRVVVRAPEFRGYFSFNMRALKLSLEETHAFLARLQSPRVDVIESFTAIGSDNTGVFTPESESATTGCIRDIIRVWNQHVLAKCNAFLKTECPTDEAEAKKWLGKRHRNEKIVASIEAKGVDSQFVIADILLFLLDEKPSLPVRLVKHWADYPKWEYDGMSNIYVYPWDESTPNKKARREQEKAGRRAGAVLGLLKQF